VVAVSFTKLNVLTAIKFIEAQSAPCTPYELLGPN
jgi:hypothetical protein